MSFNLIHNVASSAFFIFSKKKSLSKVPNSGCATPGASLLEIITIVSNIQDFNPIKNINTCFDKIVENYSIIISFINAQNCWFFQIKDSNQE